MIKKPKSNRDNAPKYSTNDLMDEKYDFKDFKGKNYEQAARMVYGIAERDENGNPIDYKNIGDGGIIKTKQDVYELGWLLENVFKPNGFYFESAGAAMRYPKANLKPDDESWRMFKKGSYATKFFGIALAALSMSPCIVHLIKSNVDSISPFDNIMNPFGRQDGRLEANGRITNETISNGNYVMKIDEDLDGSPDITIYFPEKYFNLTAENEKNNEGDYVKVLYNEVDGKNIAEISRHLSQNEIKDLETNVRFQRYIPDIIGRLLTAGASIFLGYHGIKEYLERRRSKIFK